jgi:hypothetical protein
MTSLLIQPTPLADAVQKLGSKGIVPSLLRTAEWADVPVELRDKAFFSAGVDWIQGNFLSPPLSQTNFDFST